MADDNLELTAEQAQAEWDKMAADKAAGVETPAFDAPPPDPWEGVPSVVRERLQSLEVIDHRLKSSEGRVAAIQRELDVAKQAAKQSANAPTQAQINAASGSGEKWKALKEEYTEWTDAIDERLASLPRAGADPDTIAALQTANAAHEKRIAELTVEIRHKGWEDTVKTPEFAAWMKAQPPETAALAASNDPKDAISLLDNYVAGKSQADKVLDSRQKRLQGAVSIDTQKAGQTPRKSVDDMSDQEVWDAMAREKAAKRQQNQSRY